MKDNAEAIFNELLNDKKTQKRLNVEMMKVLLSVDSF